MSIRRKKRIEELLKAEIGNIVRREMSDGITPFLSITAVEVTKDLSIAKVFVSFLNGKDAKPNLAKLVKAEGFIRSQLNKVIRLKRIPKLDFRQDESIAKAFALDEVLSRISRDESNSPEDSEEN